MPTPHKCRVRRIASGGAKLIYLPPRRTPAFQGRDLSLLLRRRGAQRLIEIGQDVVNVLDADRKPHEVGRDA